MKMPKYDRIPPESEEILFRKLSPSEERDFRQWARETYRLGQPIDPLLHPVVRDEIRKMYEESEDESA